MDFFREVLKTLNKYRLHILGGYVALVLIYIAFYLFTSIVLLPSGIEVADAATWYDTDWGHRKQITIDNTKVIGSGSHTNFAVLVNLASDAQLAAGAQADADDILFTLDDHETKLAHEIEYYNSSTGELVAWVNVPSLSTSTNTSIFMYYGYASATNQQDVDGVWNSSTYSLVHHMEETTVGNTDYLDSTSNNNDSNSVILNGTGADPDYPGQIGSSVQFDGSNDYIALADTATQTPGSQMTLQMWVNLDRALASRTILSKTHGSSPWQSFGISTDSTPELYFEMYNTGGSYHGAGYYGSFSLDNWHLVHAVLESNGTMRIYFNGSTANTYTDSFSGTKVNGNGPLTIAAYESGSQHVDARLDEIRMVNVARTSSWIQTEYNNQSNPATFYSLGSEEDAPTPASDITVAALGAETTGLPKHTSQYIGGAFSFSVTTGAQTVSSITFTETGSLDGTTEIDNVRVYYEYDTSSPYDCASESFAGTEAKFGFTDDNGFSAANNGTVTATPLSGNLSLSTTQTACVYMVADFVGAFTTTETLNITIDDPSTDVTASTTVLPATAVSPTGNGSVDGSATIDRPWYDSNWIYRKELTFDHTLVADNNSFDDDMYMFPVGLQITDADLAADAQADGDDIFFTNTFGTKLNHEIEYFNSSTGELVAWIKIPHLYLDVDTEYVMYYGYASAANQEDVANTWSGYSVVYHFGENSGTTIEEELQGLDATLNSAGSNWTSGKVGPAYAFNGSERAVTGSSYSPPNGAGFVQWWFRDDGGVSGSPFGLSDAWEVRYTTGTSQERYDLQIAGGYPSTSRTWGTGNWYMRHTYYFASLGTYQVFINGAIDTSSAASFTTSAQSGNLNFGDSRSLGNYVEGTIDEFRVRSTLPSTDWIATEYNNQDDVVGSHTVGSEENETGTSLLVSAFGAQATGLPKAANQYIGGGFALVPEDNASISGITIQEDGTLSGSVDVDNIKLYYDLDNTSPYNCASESFDGTERKFGLTDTDGFSAANSGTASFTGSISVTTTQVACVYVVMDFVGAFSDTRNFSISIDDPSSDVTATLPVSPATSVSPSGTGNVNGSSSLSRDWYDTDWNNRKLVTIDNTDVINNSTPNNEDDLYNFPVLLRITDSDLQADAQADADDIFFTNTYGTKLDHEIESFNSSTGELVAWIRLPHLYYNSDTPYVMYYGNPAASNQENVTGVWPVSEYGFVHHLEETTTGNTDFLDSTANNNDSSSVTLGGAGSNADANGVIGSAVQFDGSNDTIEIADDDSQTPSGGYTYQAWVNYDTLAGSGYTSIFTKAHTSSPWEAQSMSYVSGSGEFVMGDANTSGTYFDTGTQFLTNTSTWYYVVGVKEDGGTMRFYLNGSDSNTHTDSFTGTAVAAQGSLFIGSYDGTASFTDGIIDELRLVEMVRSADWIATEYNNQQPSATFETLGSEESLNSDPVISGLSLNGGSAITLTENSTTSVSATATVTDPDGYADISSVNGVIYRSGLGNSCSANDNNCYVVASCGLSSCAGNSCTATCTANIQYFAQPTDSGTYSAQVWESYMVATDSLSATDNATSSGVELNTLLGVGIFGSINYGSLTPGDDSGASNQVIQIRNTGNSPIDVEVSGSHLCTDYPTCGGNTITVGNQEYSDTSFTFGSGTDLSGTATLLNLAIPKATSAGSPQEDPIYWGINIPLGTGPGSFTGENSITAVAD